MIASTDRELEALLGTALIGPGPEHIQPASIDLPLGEKAYHVSETALPHRRLIRDVLSATRINTLDLREPQTLIKGQTYLVPALHADLPEGLEGRVSPKSSSGRIDVLVRSIMDNHGFYDRITGNGDVWIEITPQSYNITLREGMSLNQLRIYRPGALPDVRKEDLVRDSEGNPIHAHHTKPHEIVLSLDVQGPFIGYEGIATNKPIDLTRRDHDPADYFRPISANGSVTLEKGRFYIMATKERIRIPTHLSAEMVPFTNLLGELRVHYAGFFDPGFGLPDGASGVLEIRPQETITIYDGQPICLMEFTTHAQVTRPYGTNNNYQGQLGPRLAKFFMDPASEP